MNMHVPQSEESRVEIKELASVPSQIVSPANNKPIISLVQDTCVGSYLFTRYDNYLTREEALDILVDIPSFNGELPPPKLRQIHPWINCPIISLANTLLKRLMEW